MRRTTVRNPSIFHSQNLINYKQPHFKTAKCDSARNLVNYKPPYYNSVKHEPAQYKTQFMDNKLSQLRLPDMTSDKFMKSKFRSLNIKSNTTTDTNGLLLLGGALINSEDKGTRDGDDNKIADQITMLNNRIEELKKEVEKAKSDNTSIVIRSFSAIFTTACGLYFITYLAPPLIITFAIFLVLSGYTTI